MITIRHTTLLIIDDETYTIPLKHILRENSITIIIKTPVEALKLIEHQNPFAVVITYLPLPLLNGIGFFPKIIAMNKNTQKIAIINCTELNMAINALNQGKINAFLITPTPVATMRFVILNAIRIYNECLIREQIAPSIRISKFLGLGHSSKLYGPLTIKEKEVLSLLAKGCSNAEISTALNVTIGTVKTHLNNLFGKMDVHNRTKVVAKGMELGLIKTIALQ